LFYQLVPAKKNDRQHVGTIPGVFIHIHTAEKGHVGIFAASIRNRQTPKLFSAVLWPLTRAVVVCTPADRELRLMGAWHFKSKD